MRFFALLIVAVLVVSGYTESMRFKIARQYEKNNELDKATAEYRAGLLEEPRNTAAYLALAGISAKKNDNHAAIKHYQDALAIEPTSVLAYLGLAMSYEKIGAFEKSVAHWRSVAQYSKGATAAQAEKQIEKLMEKLRNNEKRGDAQKRASSGKAYRYNTDYFNKARLLMKKGKDKEALAYWRKVLRDQPGNPGAYYFAGVNRYNLKDYEKAIFNFKKSFDFPEKGFNAHYYLGRIAEKQGNVASAIGHYERYLPLTKKSNGRREVQARIDKLKPMVGKPQQLVQESEEEEEKHTVNKKPQQIQKIESGHHFVVHNKDMKGSTDLQLAWKNYTEDKNFNQAIEHLKQVGLKYHSSPNYIAAQFNLMNLYHLLGLGENAENAGQLLLRSDIDEPYVTATHYLLSKIYLEMDNVTKAQYHFDKIKKDEGLGPIDADKFELSSRIAKVNDKNVEGLALMEKAILLQDSPSKKDSLHIDIAQKYIREKNHKKAKKHLKEVLANCTKESNSALCRKGHYELADLYYKDQIWNLAEKYYSKVIETYPDTVNTPWGYYQMGNVMRAKDDYEEAVKYYKKVINEFPKSYWAEQARWKRVDTIWRKEYDFALEK